MKRCSLCLCALLSIPLPSFAIDCNSPLGVWKTVSGSTLEIKSFTPVNDEVGKYYQLKGEYKSSDDVYPGKGPYQLTGMMTGISEEQSSDTNTSTIVYSLIVDDNSIISFTGSCSVLPANQTKIPTMATSSIKASPSADSAYDHSKISPATFYPEGAKILQP